MESLQTPPVNKEQEKLNSGQSLDVSDILGIIAPASTDHAAESSGKPAMFDPLSFNISNANIAAGAKFRDIRDFISVCASNQKVPDEDPFGTIKVGQVELSLKESKTPLEKVNISQYMEGSLRILRAMAIEDKADLGHVLEYVNYLIKFATLAQSFQWQSLLKYDLAYRKGQSEMSFTWGADTAYLMQLHLKALGYYGGNATQVSDRHKGTYRGHITPKDRMVGLKTTLIPVKLSATNLTEGKDVTSVDVNSLMYVQPASKITRTLVIMPNQLLHRRVIPLTRTDTPGLGLDSDFVTSSDRYKCVNMWKNRATGLHPPGYSTWLFPYI